MRRILERKAEVCYSVGLNRCRPRRQSSYRANLQVHCSQQHIRRGNGDGAYSKEEDRYIGGTYLGRHNQGRNESVCIRAHGSHPLAPRESNWRRRKSRRKRKRKRRKRKKQRRRRKRKIRPRTFSSASTTSCTLVSFEMKSSFITSATEYLPSLHQTQYRSILQLEKS